MKDIPRIDIVRVWIGRPFKDGHFNGTAFFIDGHTLVTAKHVVTDRDGKVYDNIFISNTQDGGIVPINDITPCERDLALLKIKKLYEVSSVAFTNDMEEGDDVHLIGYYDNNSSYKTYKNRVSGYQSLEHTYELQNHLTNGLSGCPVFYNGKICGVAKAINEHKNLTYIIPISELCVELREFTTKTPEKKIKKKERTFLEKMASIATVIGSIVALSSLLLPRIEALFNEEEINPLSYVCYNEKNYTATTITYHGCERMSISCKDANRKHFGHYGNEEQSHEALLRCVNSRPKRIDILDEIIKKKDKEKFLYVCFTKKEDNKTELAYEGCKRRSTDCKSSKEEHFGKYADSMEADRALGKCKTPIIYPSIKKETNELLYVCYDKKMQDKKNITYEGCKRMNKYCTHSDSKFFGKYDDVEKAHSALLRCKNSRPRYID